MKTRDDAVEAIKLVIDPEIGLDLWTLELIYDITIDEDKVDILMTLTSPMCPFGPELVASVKEKLLDAGFSEAHIEITFDPMWEPSDNVKMELGLL